MNNELIPRLRFKQFNNQWHKNYLNKLASFSKGKGYSKNSLTNKGTPIILYGRLYTKYQSKINGINDTFAKDIGNNVKSKKGDVIIPASGETPIDIARASVIDKEGIILGGDLNIIHTIKDIDGLFLSLNVTYGRRKKYLARLAQGRSIVHIHNSDLKSLMLYYPTINEQQQISDFFAKLDHMTELQTQKISHLKNIKKGYLQKMFPQKGENMPRLRFNGFYDEWNKKKLDNLIFKGKSGGTPSTTNSNFYNGNINFLSISDMKNAKGIIKSTEKKITQEGLNNSSAWIVPKGAITLSMYASVGKIAKLNINLATSQAFFNMIFDSYVNNDFMYYSFQIININHLWYPLISTGTQQNLNAAKIKNVKICIPSISEQNQIGQFFKYLDQSINQQENKLTQLKQLKKGYLQKMFI